MMPTKALITTVVVASVVGLALLIERQAEAPGEVKSEQVFVSDLAGEPDKEVNVQLNTFPPASSVLWHIHPDAHEFDYVLEGTLTLLREGQDSRSLKQGEADYVAPNVVHRGLNLSRTQPAKVLSVRVKPKGAPALHRSATSALVLPLLLFLLMEAGLPQSVDADAPAGERERPVDEIVRGIELHAEMIGGEGAEAGEQGEEDGEGEHEGDGEPRHEKPDHAPGQPPDEVYRGVDRIEAEA